MRIRNEPRHPLSPGRLGPNPTVAPNVEGSSEARTPQQARTERAPLPRQPALESIQGRDGFDTGAVQGATPRQTTTLPAPVTLNLTGPVGARGANAPSDVRQVQDRLHQLGFLNDADYAAEQADASGRQPIAEQSMPRTMDALRRFQQEAGAGSDGKISPGGITARSLADPTYGTQTTLNPRTADATAGMPVTTLPREVGQIVQAIEAQETGSRALGESPAMLRNASGTPASFGRGQLIGGTALDLINSSPAAQQQYGLSAADMQSMRNIATNTQAHFRAISAQVPPGGDTEAGLQRRITEYTASQGARFRQETGLQDADIANMFRAAQLRRQMPERANGTDVDTLLRNPNVAANVEALGLSRSDLGAYLRRPANHGEHAAGFVTRALFSSPHGQALRNAMTDNGGVPLSRMLIQQNYDTVTRRATQELRRPLTAQEAAQATMLMHNGGARAVNDYFASLRQGRAPALNPYVQGAMRHWTP